MRFEVSDLGELVRKFFPPFRYSTPDGIRSLNVNIWDMDALVQCECDQLYVASDWTTNPGRSFWMGCHHSRDWDEISDYLQEIPNWILGGGQVPVLVDDENKLILDMLVKYGITRSSKVKGLSFYTLCPKKPLSFCIENQNRCAEFCRYLFEKKASKYFDDIWWVVESGKYEAKPNLHIHFLASFINSKNFRRDLLKAWTKFFSDVDHEIDYKIWNKVKNRWNRGIDVKPCNTKTIIDDTLLYMTDCEKGSHKNFTDLGICGQFHLSEV